MTCFQTIKGKEKVFNRKLRRGEKSKNFPQGTIKSRMTFCCWFTKSHIMKTWKKVAITVERILFLDMVEKFSKLFNCQFLYIRTVFGLIEAFRISISIGRYTYWKDGPKACLEIFQEPRTSDLANEKKSVQLERNWCR